MCQSTATGAGVRGPGAAGAGVRVEVVGVVVVVVIVSSWVVGGDATDGRSRAATGETELGDDTYNARL
jgi:hypothetical protein